MPDPELDTISDGAGLVGSTIGAVTRLIRTNELSPGDRLPSEAQVSRDLNVSRTVVREAFRSLAALHLIELSPGKRAIVAALDHAALSPLIEHGVHTEQISIQQIYDVRRTIEAAPQRSQPCGGARSRPARLSPAPSGCWSIPTRQKRSWNVIWPSIWQLPGPREIRFLL